MIDKSFFSSFIKMKTEHNMKSAYDLYKQHLVSECRLKSNKFYCFITGHPHYTNYTEYFKNTIDYIFHSENLKLKKLLILPDKKVLSSEGFLPSSIHPSDHIKLFCEFVY